MSFAGQPQAVTKAAFGAIEAAAKHIDMRKQAGVHPRIGATDVCPLVPLGGMPVAHAVQWSKVLGERVGKELGIPVYLYEQSATSGHRVALPDIRKGQYEGFGEKMRRPEWAPDYGPVEFNERTGATVIGARQLLVAFNISLRGADASVAAQIAARLRERGYMEQYEGGKRRVSGMLPRVRAIGWHQPDYGQAQVSMNLLDYGATSPLQAYEACCILAGEYGVEVAGSEVIGLIPEACLLEAGAFAFLKKGQNTGDMPAKLLVNAGIAYMGLDKVRPFDAQEQVLEWALDRATDL
jgi:glutamate formiminotransferase/formiminotetrahydrofolate cyclodeaminase